MAAFADDQLVGGVTAHAVPMTTAESSELFIYDIAVRADVQRQGIGRALMTALRAAATAEGIGDLFVPADNEDTPRAGLLSPSWRRRGARDVLHVRGRSGMSAAGAPSPRGRERADPRRSSADHDRRGPAASPPASGRGGRGLHAGRRRACARHSRGAAARRTLDWPGCGSAGAASHRSTASRRGLWRRPVRRQAPQLRGIARCAGGGGDRRGRRHPRGPRRLVDAARHAVARIQLQGRGSTRPPDESAGRRTGLRAARAAERSENWRPSSRPMPTSLRRCSSRGS